MQKLKVSILTSLVTYLIQKGLKLRKPFKNYANTIFYLLKKKYRDPHGRSSRYKYIHVKRNIYKYIKYFKKMENKVK